VQFIHSDANENNLLVDEAAGAAVALIDWWRGGQLTTGGNCCEPERLPSAVAGCADHRQALTTHTPCRSDAGVSWLVAEPAIAAAYILLMMLSEQQQAGQHEQEQAALQAVGHLLVRRQVVQLLAFGRPQAVFASSPPALHLAPAPAANRLAITLTRP
jgi:hypothetical protein